MDEGPHGALLPGVEQEGSDGAVADDQCEVADDRQLEALLLICVLVVVSPPALAAPLLAELPGGAGTWDRV